MPHPIPSAPHSFPSAPRPGPRLPRARRLLARSLAGASLVVLPLGLAAGCYKNVDLTEGSGVRTLTCWGDPSADNTVAKCVIFARADAPDSPGDGTREHPFTSLQTAVDAAKSSKKRVFACGSAPFEEPLSIEAPVELWGGFDCGTWHYSETARASLVGPPDLPALTFTPNGSGALVVSLSITAPPSDLTGGSSVGVVVDNVYSQTFLWRCDITVGDGKDGKDGDPPVEPAEGGTDAAFSGQAGAPTDACVPVASVEGGDPGALDCEDGKSLGGKGGFGGTAPNGTGQDGSDGMPLPQDNPMLYGVGGLGQSESADCTVGVPGAPGVIGPPGDGAQTKGALTMQGIAPVHGKRRLARRPRRRRRRGRRRPRGCILPIWKHDDRRPRRERRRRRSGRLRRKRGQRRQGRRIEHRSREPRRRARLEPGDDHGRQGWKRGRRRRRTTGRPRRQGR